MNKRSIREVRPAVASRDGDGVAIRRVAGMGHPGMDPILMVDELRSQRREDLGGGFPPHPHRGMQTLTYMKQGGIVHEDSQGNRGEIRDGGAQWMSAGRGVVHSEMPTADNGGFHGFQLWVNLAAAEKMSAPRYRDVPREGLAATAGPGFRAVAISGSWLLGGLQLEGPLRELATRAGVLDLVLEPGAKLELALTATESTSAYVYDGSILRGAGTIGPQQLVITDRGERWELAAGERGAALLVLRGEPLAEPVAHYGPFVMNTREEIEQAISDYRSGQFAVT